MREKKRTIPSAVLEQARKALGQVSTPKASATKAQPPTVSRGSKAREKIVGALRKLHPMD
jgi:hypothetical protein